MNTNAFTVLQALFCLFFLSHFYFWYKLERYEPFRRISKSGFYAFSAPVIAALTLILVSILFIIDSDVKFRLSMMVVILASILITHIKSAVILYLLRSKSRCSAICCESLERVKKRCTLVQATAFLLYAVIIPMTILYL